MSSMMTTLRGLETMRSTRGKSSDEFLGTSDEGIETTVRNRFVRTFVAVLFKAQTPAEIVSSVLIRVLASSAGTYDT